VAVSVTFKGFDRQMRKRARQIEKVTTEVIQEIATVGANKAVDTTPVKTGHARGQWGTTFGGNLSTSEARPLDPSGAATKKEMSQKIRQWRFQLGPTINFVNETEYIIPLNNGSSRQARAGIGKPTIEAMVQQGRRTVLRLPR
jgi:hypothetical protein